MTRPSRRRKCGSKRQIRELERLLGKKTLENEILREAIAVAKSKNHTMAHAHALGLVSCFTPVHSPGSNGMAESFIKSLKRDYVFLHRRPDAHSVLEQLAAWFDDYNEVLPHRGLRMRFPRQFIRAQLSTAACPV